MKKFWFLWIVLPFVIAGALFLTFEVFAGPTAESDNVRRMTEGSKKILLVEDQGVISGPHTIFYTIVNIEGTKVLIIHSKSSDGGMSAIVIPSKE